MARAEVGDDVYGEDPTVAPARGAGRRAVRPRGRAVHADRLDGQRAGRALAGRARARRCSASRAPTSRGPSWAPTRRTPASPCAPGSTRAARSTCRSIQLAVRPRHGAVLRADRRHRRSRTPTTSPAGAVLPIEDLRDLREFATGAGAAHAHGRRPDLERPRRHRRAARGVRRDRRRAGRLPVQGPRRAGRLADGRHAPTPSPRPGSGASGWAAACARSASWPRPGCTRSTTTSSGWPTTTRTPGCWPRPAASTRRRVDTNIVVVDRPDAPDFVAAAARGRRPGRHRRPHRRPPGHPPRRHPRRRREGRRRARPAHGGGTASLSRA